MVRYFAVALLVCSLTFTSYARAEEDLAAKAAALVALTADADTDMEISVSVKENNELSFKSIKAKGAFLIGVASDDSVTIIPYENVIKVSFYLKDEEEAGEE